MFWISDPRWHTKLSSLGLDAHACECFESFFTGRSHVTVFNDAQSESPQISIGVAQGSILGPLLFIIYMNDLINNLKFCCVTLFADDIVLYFSNVLQ